MIKEENLPCIRLGDALRFRPEDVEPWLQANTVTSEKDPELAGLVENAPGPAPTEGPAAPAAPDPFLIREKNNKLTLKISDAGQAAARRERIRAILGSLGVEAGTREALDRAIGKPGTDIPLGPVPDALGEDLNIIVSTDKLSACAYIPRTARTKPSATGERLLEELGRLGISHGLDTHAIQAAAHPDAPGRLIVIARGTPPRAEGEPELVPHFKTPRGFDPRILESSDFDYTDYRAISRAAKDQILAEVLLPENAQSGIDVFGNLTQYRAEPGKILRGGPNTYFSQDKLRLHATHDGIAYWKKKAICVDTTRYLPGVGYDTGNVNFDGKVIVHGDVQPGFSLEAGRKIIIKGQVDAAGVVSNKSSIEIHKGIHGGGKASVEAASNITTAFAENCRLSAGMNLTVESSIIHSSVSAAKSIRMTDPKARVVASTLSAGQSIGLVSVGSPNHAEVFLKIEQLDDDRAGAERLHLEKQILDTRKTIGHTKSRIKRLQAQKSVGLEKEEAKLTELRELLEKQENAYANFRKWLTKPENLFVEVKGTAYPGVIIVIEDRKLEIKKPVRAHRFHYSPGGIVSKPL